MIARRTFLVVGLGEDDFYIPVPRTDPEIHGTVQNARTIYTQINGNMLFFLSQQRSKTSLITADRFETGERVQTPRAAFG